MNNFKAFDRWMDKRTLLNHDILQNQVMNELSTLRICPQDTVIRRLNQWLERKGEYEEFILSTIEALSPVQLMSTKLFDTWNVHMKKAYSELFHEIFCSVSRLDGKVRELVKKLDEAANSVSRFLDLRPEERTLAKVEELEKVLGELSNLITALPQTIVY